MKSLLNFQKRKNLADQLFKTAMTLCIGSVILCFFTTFLFPFFYYDKILLYGSGILFSLGMVFLCFANAEGMDVYFSESYEELSLEEVEELKKIVEEAKTRISVTESHLEQK